MVNKTIHYVPASEAELKRKGIFGKIVNFVSWLAAGAVYIISIPFLFIGKFFADLLAGYGVLAVAAAVFISGMLMTTNNYWQALGQTSFLPFYFQDPWTGISVENTISILLSPYFFLALIWGLATSIIQGKAVRSGSVPILKAEFEEWAQHTVPPEPTERNLDMAHRKHKKLKKAGTTQDSLLSFLTITFWVVELIVGFYQNNPFRFADPMLMAGNFIYVLMAALAPECGYAIWCDTQEKFQKEDKEVTEELNNQEG